MQKRRNDETEPDIALVVGVAPWWVARPPPTPSYRFASFGKALRDFLRNFSFHCYIHMVERGRAVQEKFFWLFFHIVAMAVLIIFLGYVRIGEGRLLSTTIKDPMFAIEKVAFPSVAFCSINRISNVSAWLYAQELDAVDPLHRGANYFYKQIYMLSYNYPIYRDALDSEAAVEFQQFLDIHNTKNMFYNTREYMQALTPNCSELFVRCHLAGLEVNCSAIIEVSRTKYGYCCVFNNDGRFSLPRNKSMRLHTPYRGLSVLLNGSTADDFYRIMDLQGFMVMLYATGNYGDVSSGGVDETFAESGSKTEVAVQPTILETVNEARYTSPVTRQCLFADEVPRAFGKEYTFNRCITQCRARSIQALCNCGRFRSPREYMAADGVWCNLRHVECLRRYTFKWSNAITKRANITGLEREMEDSLYCPECYPSCSETRYATRKSSEPLTSFNLRGIGKDIDSNNSDLALVHIYFAKDHCTYLVEMLLDSWFEVFSTFGNICSVIAGISLAGICEVVFFVVRQLYAAYQNEANAGSNRKIKPIPNSLIILP